MTYEYLLTGLPELKAGSDAPINLEKLEELLDEQLSASDKKLLDLLRTPINEETLGEGLKAKNRFIREWFEFNRDMNNVLVAQICRKHGFDAKTQIVGEGEVAEQLRTHTTQKDFGLNELSGDYSAILALAQIEDLMEREKAMDAIRFEWLQHRTEFDFFSPEMVFAYYLEAAMLHRWSLLTVEEGERVFRDIVADLKKGVNLDA
ncbi:MAG: DUF2764 family protein [Paludibacteraceae bacterium]|nr:DUF2764 family protein [Paludibacteraceae bacterium]